jgi:cytochrome c oxidase subunit 4
VGAFVALTALATLSLIVATTLHWAGGDLAISLVIAALKTGLVLWFFMDMGQQPFQARLGVVVAAVLVILLVSLTATDVATRLVMPRGPVPPPGEAFFER